jgi:hypothetical protein
MQRSSIGEGSRRCPRCGNVNLSQPRPLANPSYRGGEMAEPEAPQAPRSIALDGSMENGEAPAGLAAPKPPRKGCKQQERLPGDDELW